MIIEPILYLVGSISILAGMLYFARKFENYGENKEKIENLEGLVEDENKARKIRDRLHSDSKYSDSVRRKYTRK